MLSRKCHIHFSDKRSWMYCDVSFRETRCSFSYAFLDFLLILTSGSALQWHYKPQSLFQILMLPSSIHVWVTDMILFSGRKIHCYFKSTPLLFALLCFTSCSINRSEMSDVRNWLFYWISFSPECEQQCLHYSVLTVTVVCNSSLGFDLSPQEET